MQATQEQLFVEPQDYYNTVLTPVGNVAILATSLRFQLPVVLVVHMLRLETTVAQMVETAPLGSHVETALLRMEMEGF